ncbi:MAG: hypothetical protein M1380_12370 [Chloroflexi bacterium]|nr:hypothetical protein [Chloroflexota bacterium]
MTGESYDPTWIVELAKAHYPEDLRLHQALAACTRVLHLCDCGCGTAYFVELSSDVAGEESDFGLRVALQREDGPAVVVDLLPDGRVASIETGR